MGIDLRRPYLERAVSAALHALVDLRSFQLGSRGRSWGGRIEEIVIFERKCAEIISESAALRVGKADGRIVHQPLATAQLAVRDAYSFADAFPTTTPSPHHGEVNAAAHHVPGHPCLRRQLPFASTSELAGRQMQPTVAYRRPR